MAPKLAAGLILWRKKEHIEILLLHPGGPFFKNKDDGWWSLPKGQADDGEEGDGLLEVAKREFEEETSFKALGNFTYVGEARRARDGKVVRAWAFEGDCDPSKVKSNLVPIEWPPRSGKKVEIPEIDRGAFFTLAEARIKIQPYMAPLIDLFEATFGK
jgi:predicted NUDIX family NTP pyrophosphohydrolase